LKLPTKKQWQERPWFASGVLLSSLGDSIGPRLELNSRDIAGCYQIAIQK